VSCQSLAVSIYGALSNIGVEPEGIQVYT